jgi:uncharacterized protein YutD
MKNINIDNREYEVIEDVREGLDVDEIKEKLTDYFYPYDYIVGDWAYGKLRLKGFYDPNNKQARNYNMINGLNKYLKENCAYNCKYFVIKKCIQK